MSPLSANGGQWSLSATSATGVFDDDISLFVNGEQVAKGTLGPSSHHDIHITGDYQQHIVLGICSRTDGDPVIYTCGMYVDGSELGTLRWDE